MQAQWDGVGVRVARLEGRKLGDDADARRPGGGGGGRWRAGVGRGVRGGGLRCGGFEKGVEVGRGMGGDDLGGVGGVGVGVSVSVTGKAGAEGRGNVFRRKGGSGRDGGGDRHGGIGVRGGRGGDRGRRERNDLYRVRALEWVVGSGQRGDGGGVDPKKALMPISPTIVG